MSQQQEPSAAEAFIRLLEVVRELRRRCPWDREQTLGSAAKYLIEEAHEAAGALDRGEPTAIADELGDVIVQVLMAATIAAEQGSMNPEDPLTSARRKLIRRHPHIYADVKADTVEQVIENWDRIKREERGRPAARSALDEAGRELPALMRAERLGEAARKAGMDWPSVKAVLAKVREELDEAEAALGSGDAQAAADEIGDMMLALANAPRFLGRDAEQTMRRACDKFVARFEQVERLAEKRQLKLADLSPAEIDALWNEAKRSRAPGG